jgi:hypothetical protein
MCEWMGWGRVLLKQQENPTLASGTGMLVAWQGLARRARPVQDRWLQAAQEAALPHSPPLATLPHLTQRPGRGVPRVSRVVPPRAGDAPTGTRCAPPSPPGRHTPPTWRGTAPVGV